MKKSHEVSKGWPDLRETMHYGRRNQDGSPLANNLETLSSEPPAFVKAVCRMKIYVFTLRSLMGSELPNRQLIRGMKILMVKSI